LARLIGFPLIADAGAVVRDETRQIGMVGDLFTRLLEYIRNGEDEQRMAACRIAAVEHQSLRALDVLDMWEIPRAGKPSDGSLSPPAGLA
jgi:hypothetical protein